MIVGRVDGRIHDARQPRDSGGNAEHHGKAAVDVDAQQTDRFAVRHPGADDHAEGGELQEGKDRADDQHREAEIYEAPVGVDQRTVETKQRPEIKAAGKGRRRGRGNGVRAVEILDDLLQHDGKAEGHKDLVRMGAFVEVLDEAAFHDEANRQHHGDREEDRQRHGPVHDGGSYLGAEPCLDIGRLDFQGVAEEVLLRLRERDTAERQDALQRNGAEGADHEKRAMGEVDHPQRAEDQGQTEGDQRIGRALVEAVQKLKKDCVHGPHLECRCTARLGPARSGAGRTGMRPAIVI